MDKLVEELTYFAYDGEMSFFDITKAEAKAFLNKLGEKDNEIERLNNIINELEKYIEWEEKVSLQIWIPDLKIKLQELKGSDK